MLLLLCGCAATPPAPTLPSDPEAAWQRHRAQVGRIEAWRITGRVAGRAGSEGGQAHLEWHQRGDAYDMLIAGPLGTKSLRLSGTSRSATLDNGRDPPVTSDNPTVLLYEYLGWWIPVESLRYWALGLPAPGSDYQWRLDPFGRLEELEQGRWHIRFMDYAERDGVVLPGRLFAEGEGASIRIAVDRWSVEEWAGQGDDGERPGE